VTVATGPGLEASVAEERFEYRRLILGSGSNPGLIRGNQQPSGEERRLKAFFEASRRGMVPTLEYQARSRLHDLLWKPDHVARRIREIVDDVNPTLILSDHLAFGATAALKALEQPYVGFMPGHPSVMVANNPYGYPSRLPSTFDVDRKELATLYELCSDVVQVFTARFNESVARINPAVDPVRNAFAETSGLLTLVNYPGRLGASYDIGRDSRFIGSAVRKAEMPDGLERRMRAQSRSRVFVSLGSFFSARDDLLHKLVAAFRNEPVDLVLATGITSRDDLGPLPDSWIVEPYLPQPAVIPHCDLVVTHGGNNTVTEALTAGVPLLIGPLSTDQFTGAADIESDRLGLVFDPNHDEPSTIAERAHEIVSGQVAHRARAIGRQLRELPGEEVAVELIQQAIA
jgi:MGT family glycosyltransferase